MTTETPSLERKLVAILAVDVVGYSCFMLDNEERTLVTLTSPGNYGPADRRRTRRNSRHRR